jgi:hypothetical protein
LGYEAEAKDHLTLDEVAQFTASGHPMIALAQVWRSEKNSPASVAGDYDNGHYIVVLGVDKDYVYFQDPYARMSKAFMPRKAFIEHWHHVMGADQKKNPKLMQLGIFVRGKKPVARETGSDLGLSTLDFQKFGSLNLITIQFPRVLMPYDFVDELKGIFTDDGNVRQNAFIFIRKDKDGNISGMEGGRLNEADDLAAINAVIAVLASQSVGSPELARSKAESAIRAAAEGDFGLSADDIQKLAQKLPPDHSALILLFENTWERKFKEVVKKYDGALINQRLITSEALVKATRELSA